MSQNAKGKANRRLRHGICVLGIAAVLSSAVFIALPSAALAAQGAQTKPDFTGYWERPQPTVGAAMFYPPDSGPGPVSYAPDLGELRRGMPMIGDETNPILLPHAIDALQAQRALYATGDPIWSAWALCWPPGIPLPST